MDDDRANSNGLSRRHSDLVRHAALVAILSEFETYDPNLTVRDIYLSKEQAQDEEIEALKDAMLDTCVANVESHHTSMKEEGVPEMNILDKGRMNGLLEKKCALRDQEFKEVHDRFTAGALASYVDLMDVTAGSIVCALKNESLRLQWRCDDVSVGGHATYLPLDGVAHFNDNNLTRLTRLSQLEHPPFLASSQQVMSDENIKPSG